MEGILEKLGWKKVAALLIVVSLFGLVFVYASLTEADKTALFSKKSVQNPSSNPANTNFEITKAPLQKHPENLAKTYITPFYQISYPARFNSVLYNPSGSLSSIALVGSNSSVRIEIIAVNSQDNSIDSMSTPFIALGYTKMPLSLQYNSGVKYQGVIKSIPVMHETVVIIKKDSNIVRLLLNYRGTLDSGIESTFDDIIESLK